MPFLEPHQRKALDELQTGSILHGGVGSGKSRTGLAWYWTKISGGGLPEGGYHPPKRDVPLYIITTAKKRDDFDWIDEASYFMFQPEVIDSWQNIGKYENIEGAAFIFDEQKLIGNGVWVKAFLKIAKNNHWILLSATPGDCWLDYIPVFIANGFYRNRTEFYKRHVIMKSFSKYPAVESYKDVRRLLHFKNQLLVDMEFQRSTIAHNIYYTTRYDKDLYKIVYKDRWDPYKDQPIDTASSLCYCLRRVVNSDPSRREVLTGILNKHDRVIVFYNFDYELDILRNFCSVQEILYSEWNGHNHHEIPEGESWVYLVQYTSGSEGWNCIDTNAIVFYSQNYSWKTMKQAAGRIDRMTTPYTDLYYYNLVSVSKIDTAIQDALRNKEKFNERII